MRYNMPKFKNKNKTKRVNYAFIIAGRYGCVSSKL